MATPYNLENIRTLLTEGFTDYELRAFCYDRSEFHPVHKQLANGTGKEEIVHRLVEHTDRKELFEPLLAWAREQNPAKYNRYQPYVAVPNLSQQQQVQIFLQGDFPSLSIERQTAIIDTLAGLLDAPNIQLNRVSRGSIVFDLGIPEDAVQRLRSLLESDSEDLHSLKVEKVLLEKESGETEEWTLRGGKFELVNSYNKYPPPIPSSQRVQIFLQGSFSSLSVERRDAVIDALGGLLGIPVASIELYRISEGSIIFDLGIPEDAVQTLRDLLESNSDKLRLLNIEKVILMNEGLKAEEWIFREGKFEKVAPYHPIRGGWGKMGTWFRKILSKPELVQKAGDHSTQIGGSVQGNVTTITSNGSLSIVAIVAMVLVVLVIILVIGGGLFLLLRGNGIVVVNPTETPTPSPTVTDLPVGMVDTPTPQPTATDTPTLTPSPTPTFTPSPSPTPNVSYDYPVGEPVTTNKEWELVVQEVDGVEMVLVPIGCFMMGSEFGDSDELPVQEFCIDEPFWIDRYEVTNAQFAAFGGYAREVGGWSEDDRPRENITWAEARDFCEKSRGARLPSEVEWEYAAAGPESWTYPWGNSFSVGNAVYGRNSNNQTAEVGSKPDGVSWVGALDLSGNVWEWTSTIYKDYPYTSEDGREIHNNVGQARVARGGSWFQDRPTYLRTANRFAEDPNDVKVDIGFRCVRPFTGFP